MVRTKADNCARKAVAAKAPRKNLGASSTALRVNNSMKSPAGKKSKYAGGNSVCPRPTPEWQREITKFMIRSPKSAARHKENVVPEDDDDDETAEAGCSKEYRTDEAQGSGSSPSRVEDETGQEMEDDDDEQEEEAGEEEAGEEEAGEEEAEQVQEAGGSSSLSSKRKFMKNNCISDSEDDD